ncbi:MAG: tRNA lysidine(34) synthetase TilS [Desulfobulbus sp.]|nr:tRNA lysidine(34) synthetase TilS [Desulfobulbus sp.]
MAHPLVMKVQRVLTGLPKPVEGDRVLIGVSGGPDSMALLHVLAALRQPCSLTLFAAYIDHGLRPDEVPQEWSCVEQAAHVLGIECTCISVDVYAEAARRKLSIEHAARELRYRALAELGMQWRTGLLAVAHTADDQAEEVLLRLLRGGGRKALSGMSLQAGHVIRPFLGIRKSEVFAYLKDQGIVFCHDSSNDEVQFLRNRVRLELLPFLETRFDPGIRSALLKTAANLAEDEELLEQLLSQSWDRVIDTLDIDGSGYPFCRLHRPAFVQLHGALQRRLIEQLLWRLDAAAHHAQILAVVTLGRSGRPGSELHLRRGLRVVLSRTHLTFSYPQGKGPWRGRLHSH